METEKMEVFPKVCSVKIRNASWVAVSCGGVAEEPQY